MRQEDRPVVGKCYGSAMVGPRGQLVVPVEGRRELGIDVGTKLLAFNLFQGRGLLFVKVEAVEELLNVMSQRVSEFVELLSETKITETGNERNRS